MPALTEVAPGVYRFVDTCHVYVVVADGDAGRQAIAIDFGSGDVLDHLPDLGIDGLAAVLMTHHHRDQGQGLARAVEAGIPIVVPPVERDLFDRVDDMWNSRVLYNDYNLRQDRFSLLDPVPVAAAAPEYRTQVFGGTPVATIPTPGHTMGSVTYLVDTGGTRIAFTGDLVYAPGKVWSLAATQWSYTENEGPAMLVLSCHLLAAERPDVLLPSHGEPMHQPAQALDLLAARMQAYVDSRRVEPWDLADRLAHPFVRLTEHLLLNRTANACNYVLLSTDGSALFIDYGYDMTTGWPAGTDRAARRPWLASLPALRRDFGVTSIEVALGTHYHDDHIAGFNLLRAVEGTQIWLPEHVAAITADPMRTDLPCQWFEPITADRVLPLGGTVSWHEYEITTHDLPGHTLYAAAFEFEVDGVRVLATGDQQTAQQDSSAGREILNYQYRNRFRRGDYQRSAALYQRIAPDLLVTGHWQGRWVADGYLDVLARQGDELASAHDDLLPAGEFAPPDDGNLALLEPFYRRYTPGQRVRYVAVVANPCHRVVSAQVSLVLPTDWRAEPDTVTLELAALGTTSVEFDVAVGQSAGRRQRLAADVVIDGIRLGQQADAVADVVTTIG